MIVLERRGAGLAVVALAALLLGTSLGQLDLLNPDEGRHAEIAREMLASGHYVTPNLHGQPYGDKPVLFHWLVAASLASFGANAGAARLPSVLAALLVVVLVARGLGDVRERGAARLAALLLATTPAFVALGRFVVIDMTLTATLTVALFGLGRWWLAPHPRNGSPWIFYLALGVGCLAKGPVALVLGLGVAAAFWIVDRERPSLGELRPFAGVTLALAVAAPWYLAAWIDRPEYVVGFLGDHNVGRFRGAAEFTHREPWFYYLVALPLGLLPWSVGLPRALAEAMRPGKVDRQSRFLLCWVAVIVGFFSLSSTKLLTYALPAFPALALLVGRSMARRDRASLELPASERWAWTAATVAIAATVVAATGYVAVELGAAALPPLHALPVVGVAAVALLLARRREDAAIPLAAAAVGATLVLFAYGPAARVVNLYESRVGAAEAVRAHLPDDATLLAYRRSPHSLAFHLGRPVKRLYDADAVGRALDSVDDAALLTRDKFLGELGLEPMPAKTKVFWRNRDGTVLVLRRASD